MTERSREELQNENFNLRCFLWLIVKAAGGRITIPKSHLEAFNPQASQLGMWVEFASGDYWVQADTVTEEQKQ
jgi:hypothetical protein